MKKIIRKVLFLLILLLSASISYSSELIPTGPEGWVSDFAGVINSNDKTTINDIAIELEQKTLAEIAVVTVKNLGGTTVEDYAVQLFEKWGIGKKGKNNGVLLLVSIEDRRAKVEVGYGLEGILPDGLCGEILDKYVIPYFKQGDYGKGLVIGTAVISKVIAKDANVELTGEYISNLDSSFPEKKPNLFTKLFTLIFVIIIILIFIRHPFPFLLLMSSGFGRGGFGGGGFGGGFGGFGGGISGGGGASRGW